MSISIGTWVTTRSAVLDEMFGSDKFPERDRLEAHSPQRVDAFEGIGQCGRIHEIDPVLRKGRPVDMEPAVLAYDEEYTDAFYKYVEPKTGRRYRLSDLTAAGQDAVTQEAR